MSQKRVKKSRSFINTQNGTEEHSETPEMDVYSRILKAAARGQNLAPLLEELAQIPLEERYIWRVVSALKSVFEHYENACVWADLQTLGGMDLLRVECASRTATPFCRFLVTVCGSQPMEGTMSLAIGEAKFYNELTELARLATVGGRH